MVILRPSSFTHSTLSHTHTLNPMPYPETPYKWPPRPFLCNITLQIYEDKPVGIELQDSIKIEVIDTEAVVKGQTATSSYKPAILKGNIKTTVPPFIENGDIILINTQDASYIEKAKK